MKLPCKCCHHWHNWDRRWAWSRWDGWVPGPICLQCKYLDLKAEADGRRA